MRNNEPIVFDNITIFDLMTPFQWLSFLFCSCSVLLSLFIFHYRVKWRPQQLWYDHHYRLRFALSLTLIINRIASLMYFVLANQYSVYAHRLRFTAEEFAKYSKPPPLDLDERLRKEGSWISIAGPWVYVCYMFTTYTMMVLMLFLTMDRYKRVQLILPGSFKHILGRIVSWVYILVLLYICMAYIFENIPLENKQGQRLKHTPELRSMLSGKSLVEVVALTTGMLLYYILTLSLIINSIRGVGLSFRTAYRAIKETYFRRTKTSTIQNYVVGNHSSLAYLTTSIPESPALETRPDTSPDSLVYVSTNLDTMATPLNEAIKIQNQKIVSALKMLGCLMVIIILDILMLTAIIVAVASAGVYEDPTLDLSTFATSWIVLHVHLMYVLLDMFVRDLKNAKKVVRQQPGMNKLRPKSMLIRFKNRFYFDRPGKKAFGQQEMQSDVTQGTTTRKGKGKALGDPCPKSHQPDTVSMDYSQSTSFLSNKE